MRLIALARLFILATIGALAGTTTALAANADVSVTVTPLPNQVSVMRDGLDTYAAYRVTVQSATTNVINQAVFTGHTNVISSTEASVYVETVPGTSCAPVPNSSTAVQCNIGQLRGVADPVGSMASFVVVFKAPSSGAEIDFVWQFTYSNGNSPNGPPSGVFSFGGTTITGLITTGIDAVRNAFLSYVPSSGATLFTGVKGVPTGADPGTTTVVVPKTPAVDGTARADESFDTNFLCAGAFTCNKSTLTIPGDYTNLVVTLRRDAAFIKNGLKIENAKIYYTGDDATAVPRAEIGLCVGFGTASPQPPAVGSLRPCIAFRQQYAKNYSLNPDLQGDFEWILYSLHNGNWSF